MTTFAYGRLCERYPLLLRRITTEGALTEGRGGATREVVGAVLKLHEPAYCVVDREGFSHAFMAMEVEMLLAGVYDADLCRAVAPKAGDLITPLTAYGPRTLEQLPRVEHELLSNPQSRRAVVYVGRPDDMLRTWTDPDVVAGEMPCTCVWQFLLRDGRLHMLVYMRSWDAVWGLSYDIPSFVAVQMALARALDVKLGQYIHHAGSLHVYERHWNIEARENRVRGHLDVPWLQGSIADTRTEALLRLRERKEKING